MTISSFCQDGSCVEVSRHRDYIAVQQTDTDSDVVIFTRSEWDAFITGVKNDEFDWDKL